MPNGPSVALAPSPGFPRRAALLLCALAVLLRLATNLSRVDEHYPEGFLRGVLAQAWIEGAPVWPSQAPQIPHLRGSVVVSVLAVPCFWLFGPTTFALRLPGLLFHVAGLLTLMLLAHRQYGRRAAVLSGLLFVLAPPALAKIAVLSYGDHVESLPFILLTAFLLLRWLDDRSGRRAGLAFALGVAAGLGVSWHAQARLGVIAVGLAGLLLSPRLLLRRDCWLGLLPGLIVGLLPLALGDWITGRSGLAVMDTNSGELAGALLSGETLGKWWRFWTVDLAHSLQYPWLAAGAFTLALSGACAVGLLLAAARRGAPGLLALWRRSAPLIVYALVFSLAYATSRFQILHGLENAIMVRYVMPVVPVLLLPIGVAAAVLWERRRAVAGLVAGLVAGPALVLGTWGSLSTIDLDSILHEPPRSAVFWESAGAHFMYGALTDVQRAELRRLELSLYGTPGQEQVTAAWVAGAADPSRLAELIERHDDSPHELRPLLYHLGLPLINVVSGKGGGRTVDDVHRALQAVPTAWRPFALATAGRVLGSETRLRPSLIAILAAQCRDAGEMALFARGLGTGVAGIGLPRFYSGAAMRARMDALPPAIDRAQLAFGFGLHVGRMIHAFYPPSDLMVREFFAHAPPALWVDCARGLGTGYGLRFLDPPARDIDSPGVRRIVALLAAVDPALELPFRDGLAARS